jgi:GT2 family glycosyltransferase
MDLSIIIVNHNTLALTEQTIKSIIDNTFETEYEIIVVDNSDNQNEIYKNKDMNKNIIIVDNVENKGFGNACNIGAKRASGKYVLFQNSDTLVTKGALDRCVEYIKKDDRIGVLGARTNLDDGSFDGACKRGFPTPMSALYYFLGLDKKYPESKKYGVYHQTFVPKDKVNEVDAVSGSCMMMPKSVFDEVLGFDEDYFMYGEDLDICYKIKQNRYKVIYFADAVIIHIKGQSGLHKKSKSTTKHFYNSMLIFYNKHYKNKYNVFVYFLVLILVKFKCFLATR